MMVWEETEVVMVGESHTFGWSLCGHGFSLGVCWKCNE